MTARTPPPTPKGICFTDVEYQEFRLFLQQACGIDLGAGKEYLVATRVRRILAQEHISSVTKLLELLRNPSQRALRQEVVDAMTTNETLWFRDNYPFEYAKNTLFPALVDEGVQNIRVWCAACSSGQEPYSLSMTLNEFNRQRLGRLPLNSRIVATDISSEILASAKAGLYDRLSIARGLSQERLQTFFASTSDGHWQINANVRQCVEFKPLNLQSDSYGFEKYHIVFCRNVLIYFNAELKRRILRNIHSVLAPNAILFLGASESISGAEDLFDVVNCRPGIAFKKKP